MWLNMYTMNCKLNLSHKMVEKIKILELQKEKGFESDKNRYVVVAEICSLNCSKQVKIRKR